MGNVLEYAPLAVAVLGGALVVGAAAQGRARWLLWIALLGAVGVILFVTLATSGGASGGTHFNLTPLQEIRRGLGSRGSAPGVNLLGNVALFIPIGALVAWLSRRARVLTATGVGLLLSLAIELTQLGLGRVGDIDDLILNTAGALVGGVLAVIWSSAVGPRRANYDGQRASSSVGRAADF
jgi:glycopeptide antibiotics resistance protein